MTLKRSRFLNPALLALTAFLLLAPPAWADKQIILEASAAHTANGQSGSYDAAGFTIAYINVNVTAGSGTVNPFKVSLEGSNDGDVTFFGIPCSLIAKDVAGPGGTVTMTAAPGHTLIVNEVAVVSSATQYLALCTIGAPRVRAHWVIAGTTPSETFSVSVNLK